MYSTTVENASIEASCLFMNNYEQTFAGPYTRMMGSLRGKKWKFIWQTKFKIHISEEVAPKRSQGCIYNLEISFSTLLDFTSTVWILSNHDFWMLTFSFM